MAISYVDLEDTYAIQTDDQDIAISVKIGDAQCGAYVIFLGKDLVGTNANANLGVKANVVNKKATIAITIADTLDETNWTSVTIKVAEGNTAYGKCYGPYSKQVPNHLDTIIYTLQILF